MPILMKHRRIGNTFSIPKYLDYDWYMNAKLRLHESVLKPNRLLALSKRCYRFGLFAWRISQHKYHYEFDAQAQTDAGLSMFFFGINRIAIFK